MRREARERLAALLGETYARDPFSARRTAAPDELGIDVVGVGPLTIPVPAAQARKLCAIARPARYGLGEHTLTDSRVRNTWEVPKSRVKVDRQWRDRVFKPMLAKLAVDLGLPDGCRLTADLHAVLVYGPGQFFLPHRDSEKADAMVGTLSLILPGTSRGGALVIRHAGSTATYRASDQRLTFVAFYADCEHEVRPVTSGYRVVLTYNLMLAGNAAAAARVPSRPVAEALASCLVEHFAGQRRLVYLLDHQYTSRGLDWSRLKGVDIARVAALRAAAGASDCEAALALAEVQETWSSVPSYDDPYRYGNVDDDDELDTLVDDEADVDLDELLDWSIGLDWWIDQSGQSPQPVATSVSGAEMCATTPSSKLTPYGSEHTGYMGNYGNTVDRWYRRGAVVIWPRRLDFAVRAEASPRWALDTLAALLRDGEPARARELADSMAPFWADVVSAAVSSADRAFGSVPAELPRGPDLGSALLVATGLGDAGVAAMLLSPFRLEQLTATDAPALTAVAGRYGEPWTKERLAAWTSGPRGWRQGSDGRRAWIASLPKFCAALAGSDAQGPDGADMVARLVVGTCWDWLAAALKQARSQVQPSARARELDGLVGPLAGLLVAAEACEAQEPRQAAVELLCGDDSFLPCVVQVLRSIAEKAPARRTGPVFEALARHAGHRLEARLATPPRSLDDWSIDNSGGCGCELCATLDAFLIDPAGRRLEWPLKQQSRAHVHSRIDRQELPVRHQTRRTGRPYTLVLVKLPALFEREEHARQADEADLRWILSSRLLPGSPRRPRRNRR